MIRVTDVSWGVRERLIVDSASVDFAHGGMTAIVGPNGSGKTSLLHLMAGLRRPASGHIMVGEDNVNDLSSRRRAQRIALVEQHPSTELDLSVRQVVELGRIPHVGHWPGAKDADASAVDDAIAIAEVETLIERRWATLSGGERQRVHLARALAQRPEVLLLDEPTNHLDLAHQLGFLETLTQLGICTIAVLHDLDLAASYCDEVVVMHEGRVRASGPMRQTLTSELVGDVFGVTVDITLGEQMRVQWRRS